MKDQDRSEQEYSRASVFELEVYRNERDEISNSKILTPRSKMANIIAIDEAIRNLQVSMSTNLNEFSSTDLLKEEKNNLMQARENLLKDQESVFIAKGRHDQEYLNFDHVLNYVDRKIGSLSALIAKEERSFKRSQS